MLKNYYKVDKFYLFTITIAKNCLHHYKQIMATAYTIGNK